MNDLKFGLIVEGHGDVDAMPVLLRRIAAMHDVYNLIILRPFRVHRSRFSHKFNDFERALRFTSQIADVVLVTLDADDDDPNDLVADLTARARALFPEKPIAVAVADREFESWFLAAIESMRGRCGVEVDARRPPNTERVRDAKGCLEGLMHTRTYSETVDQVKMAAVIDLDMARRNSPSFERLVVEIRGLLQG